MSDKSKMMRDKAHADARWKREQAEKKPRIPVRCACCRKTDDEVEVMMEMGSFIACDQCIELAARAVMLRKGK